MFSATAATPVLGTPAWPVIWTSMVLLAGTGPGAPVLLRVSSTRAGARALNDPALESSTRDARASWSESPPTAGRGPGEPPVPGAAVAVTGPIAATTSAIINDTTTVVDARRFQSGVSDGLCRSRDRMLRRVPREGADHDHDRAFLVVAGG